MLSVLADPILPVFFVLVLGFIFGKAGVFSEDMARSLNTYIFYFGQPSLIFLLAAKAPFGEYNLPALGLYLLSELLLYFGIAFITYRVFRRDIREAILIGMTAIFVNHLYYVLPIVELRHGSAATAPIAGAIFVDLAVLFCGTIFLMDLLSRKSSRSDNVVVILATNPALVALVLGITANFAGPVIPSGLLTFASFAGASAAPIVLFALGIIVSRLDILKLSALLWVVVFAKVLVHPALAFGFMSFAEIPADWFNSLFVLAAGPCGAMPFVIALKYDVATETMGKAILVSTVLTLASMVFLTS